MNHLHFSFCKEANPLVPMVRIGIETFQEWKDPKMINNDKMPTVVVKSIKGKNS
jgi:hypothetical protein